MWTFVVAPAQVHSHLVRIDVARGVVQRLDVEPRLAVELVQAGVVELDVTTHGQVGTVKLKYQARLRDGFVLLLHRLGDGLQVGLARRVVLIVEEEGDHARRRGRQENILGRHALGRGA